MADLKFKHEDYKKDAETLQAKKNYDTHVANPVKDFSSLYTQKKGDALNKYVNREKFKYDVNGDALYQQYKDKFTQQGKMAMQDRMGQAAAMTGGYGNSYAATVGNQAYQGAMQNLNDVIPELYSLALDRYQQEGQDMLNAYSMYSDMENTEYARHRDDVSDWYAEESRLADRYDVLNNFGYGVYSDKLNLEYTDYRNGIADEQWEQSYDLQEDAADATVTQEMLEEGYSVDDATKIDEYMTDLIDNGGSRAEAERFLEMLLSGNASLNQEILDNYFGPEDAVDTTVVDIKPQAVKRLEDSMIFKPGEIPDGVDFDTWYFQNYGKYNK